MGLSVHDPFVDPLGNPLGLARSSESKLAPVVIDIPGAPQGGGTVTGILRGATKYRTYRVTAVGAGGRGHYPGGGGGGAAATDILPTNGFIDISYAIGANGNESGVAAVSVAGYSLRGLSGKNATNNSAGAGGSATGGFTNFSGGAGGFGSSGYGGSGGGGAASQFGPGTNGGNYANNTPSPNLTGGGGGGASGGGSGVEAAGGGGGGIGCDGGASLNYAGGKSQMTLPIAPDPNEIASFAMFRSTPGEVGASLVGGTGGVGGGGGGGIPLASNTVVGVGGPGIVRIELWP